MGSAISLQPEVCGWFDDPNITFLSYITELGPLVMSNRGFSCDIILAVKLVAEAALTVHAHTSTNTMTAWPLKCKRDMLGSNILCKNLYR